MSFDLEEVYKFASDIVEHLAGEANNNITYGMGHGWETYKSGVIYHQQNSLEKYAHSLRMAAAFLIKRRSTIPVTYEEQSFIDEHMNCLIGEYTKQDFYVPREFSYNSTPLPVNHTSLPVNRTSLPINRTSLPVSPNEFLNSNRYLNSNEHLQTLIQPKQDKQPKAWAAQFRSTPAFIALENYLTYLRIDPRNHTYVVDKVEYLESFINNLTTQTSMTSARGIFDGFYAGKRKAGSDYDVLNTGRDRTTRFFSCLGMRTSTIELIDNLSAVLKEFENENSDSVDCCC